MFGTKTHLPDDLEEIPAGVELMLAVEAVDPDRLSLHDRVRLSVAHQRLVTHLQAGKLETMVELARCRSGEQGPMSVQTAREAASREIQAALKLTPAEADAEIWLAVTLVENLPRVFTMLQDGRIDLEQARLIADASSPLDPDDLSDWN